MPDGNGKAPDLKWITTLVGLVMALGGAIGGYFKGQQDMKDLIHEVQLESQKERDSVSKESLENNLRLMGRIDLLEENVTNKLEWQERSIDQIAKYDIPQAFQDHERKMHPKNQDTTEVAIKLPEKPKEKKPPKWMKPSGELELLLKKKQQMANE